MRFTFFGCSIDVVTDYYEAQVDSAKRTLLGVMCIYFTIVRQSYLRQVTRVPLSFFIRTSNFEDEAERFYLFAI